MRALIVLPVAVRGECEIEDYHSLAVRDLQRSQGAGLPSGEAVARYMGIAPLTAEQVGLASTRWQGETPLWYYILREADTCTGVIVLAWLVAGLLRRYRLDSSMRTRHRIVGSSRNGSPKNTQRISS